MNDCNLQDYDGIHRQCDKQINQLTKERDDLQNLYRNAYTLSQSCEKGLNIVTKERDDLRTRAETAEACCAEMRKCFAMDTPWPVYLVLEKLSNGVLHLLTAHNCDCRGHDELSLTRKLAMTQALDMQSIPTDCGKPILERVKRLEEALKDIARYPIHSEPMGGAMDMQDIATKALETGGEK